MDVIILNDVSKEVRDQFVKFIPTEFENYIDGGAMLLGAVYSDDEGLEAAGITILTIKDGDPVIKWIWMDPELRLMDGGFQMVEAAISVAKETGMDRLLVHVPALDSASVEESDMTGFFLENGFVYQETIEEPFKVFVLATDVQMYLDMANMEENLAVSKERLEKAYKKIPNRFKATGIEYYSGVPID